MTKAEERKIRSWIAENGVEPLKQAVRIARQYRELDEMTRKKVCQECPKEVRPFLTVAEKMAI